MEVPAEIHTNSGRNVWKSWICLLMFVVHAVIIWWRSNLSWVCEREWNYILCRKKEKMSPECKWSIWPVRSCWWLQDTGSIKFTSQSPSFQCRNCFIKSTKGPENLQQATLFGFPFTKQFRLSSLYEAISAPVDSWLVICRTLFAHFSLRCETYYVHLCPTQAPGRDGVQTWTELQGVQCFTQGCPERLRVDQSLRPPGTTREPQI